jgi:membrane protein
MKLLERLQREQGDNGAEPTMPADARQPQPEHDEPRLEDPTPEKLSRRDYAAIVKRSFKEMLDDNLMNIAAALAYYAFLAIPSVLIVAVGIFSLVGDESAANRVVARLGGIIPHSAQTLLRDSLTTLVHNKGTGLTVLLVGSVLAIWSLTGVMQNVMWGLNVTYEREETRGFVRRRLTSLVMVVFAALGVVLVFGLLVLGPHLQTWVGDSVGQKTLVTWVWWVAQWPVLVVALLVAFAGIYHLGPNVEHPRWQFLTLGSVLGIVI